MQTRTGLVFTGNASDSDGGDGRADLLGIGYGSDGVGSEGAAALKQVGPVLCPSTQI